MKKQLLAIAIFKMVVFVAKGQTYPVNITKDTNYSIQLIGDANSFKTLSESGNTPANAAVGLLYTKYFKPNLDTNKHKFGKWFQRSFRLHSAEVGINFNVASTVDTLKANYQGNQVSSRSSFGSSVLIPGNSGQSSFFNVKAYFGKLKKDSTLDYDDKLGFISGFYANFNQATRNWYDSSKNVKSSTISLGIGVFYDFIDYKARDNDNKKVKSIYAGVGYAVRWVVSDIALNEQDDFRKNLLGTNKTTFHGVEFTLGAKIENARIELKIPIFFGTGQTPGLSGTQPYYQIGFSGGITIK